MAQKSKRGKTDERNQMPRVSKKSSTLHWWILLFVGLLCAWLFGTGLADTSSDLFHDLGASVQMSEIRVLAQTTEVPESQDGMKKFPFKSTRSGEVRTPTERWNFEESIGYVPDKFGETSLFRISSLVDPDDARVLRNEFQALLYDKALDTVDQLPSFEATLFRHGRLVADKKDIVKLKRIVEHRVLPYVRERFNCNTCVACTSIVRRYIEGERRNHPWHYDNDAFVTVVVPLTAASEYRGGIYVQPSFDLKDRQFIDLEAGDAVVHNFDVLHGVEVLGGDRVSLIIWIKSDADACANKTCPWYADKAQEGNPNAEYNYGRVIANGMGGSPEDRVTGVKWYLKAANQGHVMAMYNLAVCLHHGRGLDKNETEAVAWYGKAAEGGHPLAMTNYGYMMLFGKGVQQKNASKAAEWFQKASMQQVTVAMFQLAHLFAAGDGIVKNMTAAEYWLQSAASRGHRDATKALSSLRSTGRF